MSIKEFEVLEALIRKAQKSVIMVRDRPAEYFLRAIVAGLFIGLIVVFTLKSINGLYLIKSPMLGLIGGLTFSIALIMIIYGGGELFTGNALYFSISSLRQETSILDTLRVWGMCYAGNFVGAIGFALLFYPTGIIQHLGMDNWLFSLVEAKMHSTTTEIFFKAIFCNWVICLAIFLPQMISNEFGKIFVTMFLVVVFFVSGYDHCIANMSFFSLALFVPHPDTITLAGAVRSVFLATLGNMIGGGLFVGVMYTWLNAVGLSAVKEKMKEEISKG